MDYALPTPGTILAGKYTVERQLGMGGMGAVYVVNHRITGKRLALKCLLPEHARNTDIVERFMREAQTAGRIQHRHVVDVFDVGRVGDLLFIVMEYLEGKPLSDLLQDTALTLGAALAIITRAMEGVSAAHAQNIIHRDLKPENIFVCVGPSGTLDDPRVLDFGISKVDEPLTPSLTKTGAAMGTPYYMSLEQMSGQKDLDARVDVYAMGVILYEAIAGEPPHVADSLSALAIRVLTTAPVHLSTLRPDLPPGLAAVVMKAIARDRDQRYPNIQALIDALKPHVEQTGGLPTAEQRHSQPLRTPRSADLASEQTMQANVNPLVGSVPGLLPAEVASKPAAGGDAARASLMEAGGSLAEPRASTNHEGMTAPRRGRSGPFVLGAAVVLLLLVAGYFWRAQSAVTAREQVTAPTAGVSDKLPSPATPSEPSATPTPAAVDSPAAGPAQTPQAGAPTGELPTGAEIPDEPPAENEGHVKQKPRKHRDKSGAAANQPTASEPVQAAPSKPKVKGRAGEIAADDF
jgi:serine/threonine protein kinase